MATDIVIPADLWEEENEAVITNWLAGDGSQVKAGQLIVEIMVEKIQYGIDAPIDGTLTIAKQSDAIVKKGDVIGSIG